MKDTLNNSSYFDYMKHQLALLSSGFVVKVYKRADLNDWRGFLRGQDFRIQIQFKKKCLFEFVVEQNFCYQRNTNKEDRTYMRRWADPKIQMIKDAQIKLKPKKKTKKISNSISCTQNNISCTQNSISCTQDAFEKMKNT